MAWELLPVDYTDAIWSGLKKYVEVSNEDGTVSFQDVTVYTNKEKSFFGAIQANRMNGSLNTIMSTIENGANDFASRETLFSADGKSIEETYDNKKIVTEFVSNTVIVEKLYLNGALNLTKTITFSDDGMNIKEVVE